MPTATGTDYVQGRTIGVDPEVIPLGSLVVINGNVYVAEDTGNFTGNIIDVYIGSHEQALQLGTYEADVYARF